jgi:hypothetical protein
MLFRRTRDKLPPSCNLLNVPEQSKEQENIVLVDALLSQVSLLRATSQHQSGLIVEGASHRVPDVGRDVGEMSPGPTGRLTQGAGEVLHHFADVDLGAANLMAEVAIGHVDVLILSRDRQGIHASVGEDRAGHTAVGPFEVGISPLGAARPAGGVEAFSADNQSLRRHGYHLGELRCRGWF